MIIFITWKLENVEEVCIIKFKINGKDYECNNNQTTVHDFLSSIGIVIPKICHVKNKTNGDRCKVCVVEINNKLSTSCNTTLAEGMDILTHSHKALKAREWTINFLLSHHPALCYSCHKMGTCKLAEAFMISGKKIKDCFRPSDVKVKIKQITTNIQIDYSKCVYCGQCDDISKISKSTIETCPTGALEDLEIYE